MRELTAFEIENVSGAGWLQDGLASLGSKGRRRRMDDGTDALSINLPLIGTLNLADLAPDLGKTWAKASGRLSVAPSKVRWRACPVIGGLLNKLLGN